MRLGSAVAVWALVCVTATGADIAHRFVCIDNVAKQNQLIHIDQKRPQRNWAAPLPGSPARDIQLVAPDRILISIPAGCREYDLATGRVLWEVGGYKRIYTARRLSDGRTLLGENGAKGIVLTVVDRAGKELSRRVLTPNTGAMRVIRITADGNYLLNLGKPWRAAELTPAGETVWEANLAAFGGKGYKVLKTAAGHYLASTGNGVKIIELDRDGALVRFWGEAKKGDHPDWRLDFFSGFDALPNGHVVAANWLGHGKHGTGPHLVEFDVRNRLVWQWEDHAVAKQITNVMILDHREVAP